MLLTLERYSTHFIKAVMICLKYGIISGRFESLINDCVISINVHCGSYVARNVVNVKTRNRKGPKTEHWGTTDLTMAGEDVYPFTTTGCSLSHRNH